MLSALSKRETCVHHSKTRNPTDHDFPEFEVKPRTPFHGFLHQLADFPNKTSPLKNHLNHIFSQFLMVRNGKKQLLILITIMNGRYHYD